MRLGCSCFYSYAKAFAEFEEVIISKFSSVVPQIEIRILNIDVMLVSGFLLAITIETENLVWRLMGYNYFFSIKFEVYGSCFLEAWHNWTPLPPELLKKGGIQIFPIKGGVGKIGVFRKEIILSNPLQGYLSLKVWWVGVLFIKPFYYTLSISIICVSQEEPSLIASNQQIYELQVSNFWKEKTLWKVNFGYQWIIYSV